MSDWWYRNVVEINWHRAFNPNVAVLDVVMRGTIMYLVLFTLLRLSRRRSGDVGITDVLLVVLIADAVQNAMASNYHSITEGVGLVLTIFFWSWFLDWLAFKIPRLHRVIAGEPLAVVRDGAINQQNLRRQFMTETDLRSLLRVQGVDDVRQVKLACVEGNGQLSVVKQDG